ncbi:MAG: aminotransferase class V-fold PLP-dependent enzyme, partial [Bacteroidota bacterium]
MAKQLLKQIMEKPVYLDYNATTPIDPEVAHEMIPYIQTSFGNPSSSYSIGRRNKEAIEGARKQVAYLINAKPEEIISTSGGTESNNHAIRGTAFANKDKGKHIITSSIEHPAVTEVCRYLNLSGYEITWLPVDTFGMVNPKDVDLLTIAGHKLYAPKGIGALYIKQGT